MRDFAWIPDDFRQIADSAWTAELDIFGYFARTSFYVRSERAFAAMHHTP